MWYTLMTSIKLILIRGRDQTAQDCPASKSKQRQSTSSSSLGPGNFAPASNKPSPDGSAVQFPKASNAYGMIALQKVLYGYIAALASPTHSWLLDEINVTEDMCGSDTFTAINDYMATMNDDTRREAKANYDTHVNSLGPQTKLAKRATNPCVVHAELAQSLSHPNILVTDEVYQDFQNFVHDQQQDDDVESPFGAKNNALARWRLGALAPWRVGALVRWRRPFSLRVSVAAFLAVTLTRNQHCCLFLKIRVPQRQAARHAREASRSWHEKRRRTTLRSPG
jgi:hypothetical protein